MKKTTLIIAALALASSTALASKARRTAINNSTMSMGGTDVQEIFSAPVKLAKVADLVTFEFGAATSSREGGFIDSMGDGKLAFYLGRDNNFSVLSTATGLSGSGTQVANPFDLIYAKSADMSWGLGLHYGSFDDKATPFKGNTMTASFGVASGSWEADLVFGLGSSAENATIKATGTSKMDLYASYKMSDSYKLGFAYLTNGFKKETSGTETGKFTGNTMKLYVEGKKSAMFWGLGYETVNNETTGTLTAVAAANILATGKYESTSMPVYVGVEADAASWLVLRGSISQNILMGSVKSGGTDQGTVADNTNAQAGFGMKFDKFMLDTVMLSSTSGSFGLADVHTQASLSYMF